MANSVVVERQFKILKTVMEENDLINNFNKILNQYGLKARQNSGFSWL